MSIGLALFGYGGIGRLHAAAYSQIPFLYGGRGGAYGLSTAGSQTRGRLVAEHPKILRVCTSRGETARVAAEESGADHWEAGWEAALADPTVIAVDVTVPNHLHAEAVPAALAAGKHVYCEKPLAATSTDAEQIATAVRASDRIFAMTFQYRFVPAVLRARELVESGQIGRVYSFRAEYLHSGYQNPQRPLSWRMDKERSGSGALADLGSHVIDLVRYLLGEFESVQGHLETFIPERPVAKGSKELGPVTVDDACWIRARMRSGAVGTVEASRFATGTLDDMRFWVYGERGALHFSLMDLNFLWYFDASRAGGAYGGSQGWQRLDTVAHYPGAAIPPGRAPMGWLRLHVENQYGFLQAVAAAEAGDGAGAGNRRGAESDGRESGRSGRRAKNGGAHTGTSDVAERLTADAALPGIDDGLAVQSVLTATERSHAAAGTWMAVKGT
ncbi:MAG: Gfo/Idh/MocA family oxidoreductase [Alkalispirochaeta sp.]